MLIAVRDVQQPILRPAFRQQLLLCKVGGGLCYRSWPPAEELASFFQRGATGFPDSSWQIDVLEIHLNILWNYRAR
jgi:hypothetical protein